MIGSRKNVSKNSRFIKENVTTRNAQKAKRKYQLISIGDISHFRFVQHCVYKHLLNNLQELINFIAILGLPFLHQFSYTKFLFFFQQMFSKFSEKKTQFLVHKKIKIL